MRLRHKETGVVVNVGDAEADAMTVRDWEPVDRKAPEPLPKSKPRRRSKTRDDDGNDNDDK